MQVSAGLCQLGYRHQVGLQSATVRLGGKSINYGWDSRRKIKGAYAMTRQLGRMIEAEEPGPNCSRGRQTTETHWYLKSWEGRLPKCAGVHTASSNTNGTGWS